MRGFWWRFSDYTVREVPVSQKISPEAREHFRYIVPAPGATLETYEPAIEGGQAVLSGNDQPTVVDLAALRDLELDDESAILAWCRRYGLLGILPETAFLIELAPRWGAAFGEKNPPILIPTQFRSIRTNVGWTGFTRSELFAPDSLRITLDDVDTFDRWNDQLVDLGETNYSPIAVVADRLFSLRYERKDLATAIGRYFPGVPSSELNTAKYPSPLSDDFWHQYGESIADFRRAVQGMRSILSRLSETGPLEDLPEEAQRTLGEARSELHSLLSASPGLGIELDGTFTPKWAFGSLLSMFALAIWQELVSGKSIRHCRRSRCRQPFFARRRNQEYCSSRCRWAEEKARQRSSKPSG